MQNALPNLKASLDKVRAIADDIDAHAQDALKDAAVQARHETTLCAATVILSGFLESFLREVAEEMIAEICGRSVPFDQLPAKVRVTHYWDGAAHVREMARQERSADPLLLSKAEDAARAPSISRGGVTLRDCLGSVCTDPGQSGASRNHRFSQTLSYR